MNSTKSKILVIDDDASMVQVLRLLLTEAGYRVLAATNGPEGLRIAYDEHPDLALLDIMMPEMNGFQVLEALRLVTDIPVIFLTGAAQDTNRIQGLDKGAADFLAKNTSSEVILAHIRSRLRGAAKPQNHPVQYFGKALRVDLAKHEVQVNNRRIHLTPIEWKMFQCLIDHRDQVVSYETLLNAGWDHPEFRDIHAVKVVISSLRSKLRDRAFRSRLIHTIREEGYLLEAR